MKANRMAAASCGLLAMWPGAVLLAATAAVQAELPLPPSVVTWQLSSGPDLLAVPATVVGANGQCFRVARVPFESRSAGPRNFAQTPSAFRMARIPPSTGALPQQFDATALSRFAEGFVAGGQRKLPSHRQFQVNGIIHRQAVFSGQLGDSPPGEAGSFVVHYER